MILKSVHGMIHAGVFRTDTACGATAVTAGLLCPCFPQCQPPACLALFVRRKLLLFVKRLYYPGFFLLKTSLQKAG